MPTSPRVSAAPLQAGKTAGADDRDVEDTGGGPAPAPAASPPPPAGPVSSGHPAAPGQGAPARRPALAPPPQPGESTSSRWPEAAAQTFADILVSSSLGSPAKAQPNSKSQHLVL